MAYAERRRTRGTVYAAFLALGAYEDLANGSGAGICSQRCNLSGRRMARIQIEPCATGLTTSTAAAIMLHRHLGVTPDPRLARWLLACAHPQGGFRAMQDAPIPDLLSTATALHALSAFRQPLDAVRESCLDFIDSLWTNRGGFYGNWADDEIDCEYTYYALLSLGHLAL